MYDNPKCVGLNASKEKIAVAVADEERSKHAHYSELFWCLALALR
ncbi:hypothetical protein GCM10008983_17540 [Lentibacillus halophilus]|uniref:Uncharacterized protein n=1 Tax=Lentibacillus halophilus TaxID=295065 RepID=A0ABP3J3W4_9BACI